MCLVTGQTPQVVEACDKITSNPYFETFIFTTVFVDMIAIAAMNPTPQGEEPVKGGALYWIDFSATVIFTIEMALRCIVVGLSDYCSEEPINVLVVLTAWLEFLADSSWNVNLKGFRALRLLRPLLKLKADACGIVHRTPHPHRNPRRSAGFGQFSRL